MNKRQFKAPLGSMRQVCSILLDLESKVPDSILTRGSILLLDFFHVVKHLIPILPIFSISSSLLKP